MRHSVPSFLSCFQTFADELREQLVPLGQIAVGKEFSIPAGRIEWSNNYTLIFEKPALGVVVEGPEPEGPGMISGGLSVKMMEPWHVRNERYLHRIESGTTMLPIGVLVLPK